MKTINELITKSNSQIAQLMNKVNSMQQLAKIFQISLDNNFAKHCKFASYENSKLTVIVTNNSWATKLRYIIPDVIKDLRVHPEFRELTSIRYAIDKQQNVIQKNKIKKITPDSENMLIWKKTIEDLRKRILKK